MNKRQQQAAAKKAEKKAQSQKPINDMDLMMCNLSHTVFDIDSVKQHAENQGFDPDTFYIKFVDWYLKWREDNDLNRVLPHHTYQDGTPKPNHPDLINKKLNDFLKTIGR